MKKYFLLIFIIILLSGCSTNVEVNISKEYNVKEKILISEQKDNINIENSSYDEYMNEFGEFIMGNYSLPGYEISKNITDNELNGVASKDYKGVCEFFENSTAITSFFNKINCKDELGYYDIEAKTNYFDCEGDCIESQEIDEFSIKLSIAPKVLKNNANEIEGNDYIWRFFKGSNNKLKLRIKKNILNNDNTSDLKKTSKDMLIIIIVAITVITIISYILYKKYKNNRIDY